MKLKYLAPFIGATMIMGAGVASAQSTSTGAMSGGSATATNRGATVSGGAMGVTKSQAAQQRQKIKRTNRPVARSAGQNATAASARAPTANTATTYGAGAVYTDRNSTSAGVTSGALATGTGSQRTTSTVDAYGETGRNGTSADIYGNSTASSGTRR